MKIEIELTIGLTPALVNLLTSAASMAVAVQSVPVGKPSPERVAEPAGGEPAAVEGDASEIDAHGHPWSADMHASTKGKTQEGLWRMKVGVKRPDPLPGFPVAGASATGTGAAASSTVEAAPAGGQSGAVEGEEDEFAAFREAAAKTDAEDAKAKASVPARKWTDADLGALCNQAAVKLGDPAPVKAVIAEYVPAGEVPHSRNIPEDKRAAFAAAVEAKAGIEFAG